MDLIRSNEISLKDKCSLAREFGASIEKGLYKEMKTDIDKKPLCQTFRNK